MGGGRECIFYNMKTLVLAEKPSVAREIARVMGSREKHKSHFEGSKYVVTWALGHLVGLAEPDRITSYNVCYTKLLRMTAFS